jgi:putative PIN family toxin of toxin-antitoxin system
MRLKRAVLDTNVLYAGLYSSTGASYSLLRHVDAGRLVPILSTTLLFEYEDVLRRESETLGLSLTDVDQVLDALCALGQAQRVYFLWRPELPDPKDDHLLELAIAANGAPIVTHNVKHFRSAGDFGIRVLKPAEMLEELK